MADVRIDGIRKRYGQTVALDGLDLDVKDGEFLCLLGPSGAGKTTLLRCIAGLERLDDGAIFIGGENVAALSPAERDVAMVFETYALYPHLTVAENVAYPLRERRVAEAEIKRRVERVAEMLGVTHTLNRPPQTLSGGEMQRVAIGRAIVREARVYLFDEPLSHLDAQLREHMRAELKRLHRELGSTLIFATPDQLEAMTMPDRTAVMREGKVLQCAPPEEIYFKPTHGFVASYVGEPPMNLLPAKAHADGVVTTDWFDIPALGRALKTGDCRIGVRPEDLLLDAPDSDDSSRASFEADVYAVEMHGDFDIVTLALGEHRLRAISSAHGSAKQGERRAVTFSTDRLYLIDPATEAVF